MILLMFLCALGLSAAAAFYSIVGLMAIFAAAPIPIAIMGSLLEGSKLVIASWLYRNWKEVPVLMKSYLTVALVVLMGLTSMGIFGYLSKAHMDQGVPTSDIAAKVALIEEKIANEKENLNAARKAIAQLDEQVNQTISRTAGASTNTASASNGDAGVARSIAIRRGQAKERLALSEDIGAAQSKISKLSEEKAPLAAELRKVEAEVGPIKYIAALIYGDEATQDQTLLEKAVRWVTILIVSVFDPLAVVMLIAANWSLLHRNKKVELKPVSEENLPEVKEAPPEDPVVEEKSILEQHPYLTKPFTHFEDLTPIPAPSSTEKPKRKRKPKPAPKVVAPVEDVQEHPVFDSNAGTEVWGSRPAAHLMPQDVRNQKTVE